MIDKCENPESDIDQYRNPHQNDHRPHPTKLGRACGLQLGGTVLAVPHNIRRYRLYDQQNANRQNEQIIQVT